MVQGDEGVSTAVRALNVVATDNRVGLPLVAAEAAEMDTVLIGFTAGAVQAVTAVLPLRLLDKEIK